MWRNSHFGYEDRAEEALRGVLGDGYFSRELSWTTFRPWMDVATDYGAIEHQTISRMAIVIEGEESKLAPLYEALDALRNELRKAT